MIIINNLCYCYFPPPSSSINADPNNIIRIDFVHTAPAFQDPPSKWSVKIYPVNKKGLRVLNYLKIYDLPNRETTIIMYQYPKDDLQEISIDLSEKTASIGEIVRERSLMPENMGHYQIRFGTYVRVEKLES